MTTLHPKGVNHLALSTREMKAQLEFWCDVNVDTLDDVLADEVIWERASETTPPVRRCNTSS